MKKIAAERSKSNRGLWARGFLYVHEPPLRIPNEELYAIFFSFPQFATDHNFLFGF